MKNSRKPTGEFFEVLESLFLVHLRVKNHWLRVDVQTDEQTVQAAGGVDRIRKDQCPSRMTRQQVVHVAILKIIQYVCLLHSLTTLSLSNRLILLHVHRFSLDHLHEKLFSCKFYF